MRIYPIVPTLLLWSVPAAGAVERAKKRGEPVPTDFSGSAAAVLAKR